MKYNPVYGSSTSPYFNKIDEIMALSKEGKSAYKISEILGLPRSSVDRLIRKCK